MKNLIAYFSHAGENYFPSGYRDLKVGNAEVIAGKVSHILGGDLFKIDTKKTYPVDYRECRDVARVEQNRGELPELKSYLDSIEEYENIVLVFPCWWGTMPQAVFTFLNHYDFKGKKIYPICTHEGSGMGRSESDLKKLLKTAEIKIGLAIYGHEAENCDQELKKYFNV